MRFARHLLQLLVQLGYYSIVNRDFLPLFFVLVLLSVTLAAVGSHAAAPLIYTLF